MKKLNTKREPTATDYKVVLSVMKNLENGVKEDKESSTKLSARDCDIDVLCGEETRVYKAPSQKEVKEFAEHYFGCEITANNSPKKRSSFVDYVSGKEDAKREENSMYSLYTR